MSYVFIHFGLVLYVRLSEGCSSGGGGSYAYPNPPAVQTTTEPPTTKNPFLSRDDAIRNSAAVFGGFPVPEDMLTNWKKWVKDYKQKRKDEENEAETNRTLYMKLHGPGSGFPVAWQGLGPGVAGSPPEDPPPWGYKPINTGLPALCYDAAKRGNCYDNITRWGYNAYLEICQEFLYSGCGGNFNNFKTKLVCEKHCTIMPSSGCDTQSTIYFDDFIGIMDTDRGFSTRKCNNK